MAVIKVLLAEDDSDDRELFCRFFSHREDLALMEPAADGVELFSIMDGIPSAADLPDMIILDYNMPKRNGLEALQLLRAHARYGHIPVMLYSTYTDNRLLKKFLDEGASAVILKPVSPEGYNSMMDEFISTLK